MHGFMTPPWAAPRQSSHPYVLHDACCSQSLSLFRVLFPSFVSPNAFGQKASGMVEPAQASLHDVGSTTQHAVCTAVLMLPYNT